MLATNLFRSLKVRSNALTFFRNLRGVNNSIPPAIESLDEEEAEFDDDDISRSLRQLEDRFNEVAQSQKKSTMTNKMWRLRKEDQDRKFLKKKIIQKKLRRELQPEFNLLTWSAKEQIKYLNEEFPNEWTVERLAESFPVSQYGVKQILRSRLKMRTREEVVNHDLKVKYRWDQLRNIEGETDGGPLNPTLNMLMENQKYLQLENAMGNTGLPLPSVAELPGEEDLRLITINNMRGEAGMFESYLMKVSAKKTESIGVCDESPQDKRLKEMKEGLKLLTGAFMKEAAKKGLMDKSTERQVSRQNQSMLTNTIEKHNIRLDTSRKEMGVRHIPKYQTLSSAMDIDERQEGHAKPIHRRDQVNSRRANELSREKHDTKTYDSTMELLSTQDHAVSECTSPSYIPVDSDHQYSPVRNSQHPRTPDSDTNMSIRKSDGHVVQTVKTSQFLEIDDSAEDSIMKEQKLNVTNTSFRRRQRRRMEKINEEWNTTSPHFYEKLQMHETFIAHKQTADGKGVGSEASQSVSSTNEGNDRKMKLNAFQKRIGSARNKKYEDDDYFDSEKKKEFSFDMQKSGKVKSKEQLDFEDKLSYENVIVGQKGSSKQHILKHPYYYDPVTGYQNPYGKLVQENVVVRKDQNKKRKGKYYQKNDTVYDSDGEILFRIPKS